VSSFLLLLPGCVVPIGQAQMQGRPVVIQRTARQSKRLQNVGLPPVTSQSLVLLALAQPAHLLAPAHGCSQVVSDSAAGGPHGGRALRSVAAPCSAIRGSDRQLAPSLQQGLTRLHAHQFLYAELLFGPVVFDRGGSGSGC